MLLPSCSGFSPAAWISPTSGRLIIPSGRTVRLWLTSVSCHTLTLRMSPLPIWYDGERFAEALLSGDATSALDFAIISSELGLRFFSAFKEALSATIINSKSKVLNLRSMSGLINSKLLDLVQNGLVADVQTFRRTLPIPLVLAQYLEDQIALRLVRGFLGQALQADLGRAVARRRRRREIGADLG